MKRFLSISAAIAVLALIAALFTLRHVVTRIIDGDTIEVSGYDKNIRLMGVDMAEEGNCYRNESIKMISDLLLNRSVRIETDIKERDTFGRILGYVYLVDGTFLNKRLLEMGAGEFFYDSVNLKHQDALVSAAESAREMDVGFWETCGPCVVKGNYDIHGKRYYHLPEFRHYSQVVVNLDKADRWFCSEAEAIEAGFTKARE
ncbi:MAG: nuclease [Microgenomates group bacterium Gr01-1014_16]|nr:MAG: nuclease [Microgenomates group bacterium Gr01-1014_16]